VVKRRTDRSWKIQAVIGGAAALLCIAAFAARALLNPDRPVGPGYEAVAVVLGLVGVVLLIAALWGYLSARREP
jgi:peptidoglycan/LPS O-acetylase OafA/YrhL